MGKFLQAFGGLSIATVGFVLTVLAIIIIEVYLPIADDWTFVVLPVGGLASIGTGYLVYRLLGRLGGTDSDDDDEEQTLDKTTDPYLQDEIEDNVGSE